MIMLIYICISISISTCPICSQITNMPILTIFIILIHINHIIITITILVIITSISIITY